MLFQCHSVPLYLFSFLVPTLRIQVLCMECVEKDQ
ncbi:hypothetical protein SLEP1_g2465 [Rubroshorea leprosula]|uniref:Uncharacterized protein n=1 Tax=Rubroshorea leprosula TaxID=152421 RepID=A0AAV5HN43_9ROSI|nr:hypothetical protein SLEP1_g2465 [Rubroshorea leprosula]